MAALLRSALPVRPPEPFKSQFRATGPTPGRSRLSTQQVGRVLQWLDTRGLAERTWSIAIGDHGESLNEHREGTHGLFIYEATRGCRLSSARRTKRSRRRVKSVVRSEDVMPTVLDLLGRAASVRCRARRCCR